MRSEDPTTDSVQAQLEAVLRGIEERVKHGPTCARIEHCFGNPLEELPNVDCDCDWQERVRAEQARRWAVSLEAAAGLYGQALRTAQGPPTPERAEYIREVEASSVEIALDVALAAALRAGEEHQ